MPWRVRYLHPEGEQPTGVRSFPDFAQQVPWIAVFLMGLREQGQRAESSRQRASADGGTPPLEPSARLTQRLSKPWPRRQPQRGRPAFRTECGWRFSQVPPRCESSCRETLAATGLVILFKPDLGKRRLLHGRAFPIRTVLLFGTLRAKKKSDLPRIERLSPCRPSDG